MPTAGCSTRYTRAKALRDDRPRRNPPRLSARALPIERPSPRLTRWREPSILPGFPLALGITLAYLGVIVVLPLTALALRPWELGLGGIWRSLTEERVLDALRLSFGISALAALINAPLGLLIAWVLVRYEFPAAACSTPWSICRSPCRPPSRASP